jgi:hypothetical protein
MKPSKQPQRSKRYLALERTIKAHGFVLDDSSKSKGHPYCVWFNSPTGSKEIDCRNLDEVAEAIGTLKGIAHEETITDPKDYSEAAVLSAQADLSAGFYYLTNACCDNTGNVTPRTLYLLHLPFGSFSYRPDNREALEITREDQIGPDHQFYPLTPAEAKFIGEDDFTTPNTEGGLLGYSVLYRGEKWFSPVLEYYFENDAEETSATVHARKDFAHVRSQIKALGGHIFLQENLTDDRHQVTLLLPVRYVLNRFGGITGEPVDNRSPAFAVYRAWLQSLFVGADRHSLDG